jgi:hypothetical protein
MVSKKSLAVHLDSLVSPLSAPEARVGGGAAAVLGALGAATSLAWACFRGLRHLGSTSISGAVTSEQTGYQYSSTLPPWVAGSVITASVVTELGPLSTGFVLIGRVGERIGAELGAMSVSEQIQVPLGGPALGCRRTPARRSGALGWVESIAIAWGPPR